MHKQTFPSNASTKDWTLADSGPAKAFAYTLKIGIKQII